MQTELIDDDSPEAPVVSEKSEKAESSSVSFEKKKGKKDKKVDGVERLGAELQTEKDRYLRLFAAKAALF